MVTTTDLSNVQHAKEVGPKARVASEAVAKVAQAARALAAASDTKLQKSILSGTKGLLPDLAGLLNQARAQANSKDGDGDVNLVEAARLVSEKVRQLLSTTHADKGAEECQHAAEQVSSSLDSLVLNPKYKPGDIVTRSADVEQRAKAVVMAAQQVEALSGSETKQPQQLKIAALATATAVPALINSVNKMVSATKDPNAQHAIVKAHKYWVDMLLQC